MKSVFESRDGALVVTLKGRITVGPALREMRAAAQRILEETHPFVVVDLGEVPFVDSAGLGELVACHRGARERGGQLCLARPRGKVADLLELTRIGEIIPVYPTVDAAIATSEGRS